MKIAIFGDSYAAKGCPTSVPNEWATLLSKKNNNYKIQNFAKCGTSLWWSYDLFLNNYKNFDLIIFVITRFGRLPLVIDGSGVGAAPSAINKLNYETNKHHIKLLTTARDYYIYLQNDKQDLFLHKKIVEELVKVNDKKIILIPIDDSIPIEFQKIFKHTLHDITQLEIKTNFKKNTKFIMETEHRSNHMSIENNIILAEKLHQVIQGTCDSISIDDFTFIKYSNPEKYWKI